MNILFVDSKLNNNVTKFESFLYKNIGFYFKFIKKENVASLLIEEDNVKFKLLSFILKKIYNNKKVFIVFTKNASLNKNLVETLLNCLKDKIIVTEQNNLLVNDEKYINKYILKENIQRKDVSILFIIDNLTEIIKLKIEKYIKIYKTIDILNKSKNNAIYDYIEKINRELGSTIEVLDNMPKKNYNIVLMFTKEHEASNIKDCSFILDYNNSDLDVESNTYLMYIRYKKKILYYLNILGMDISRFEKTKLGKLCIHTNGLTLDK